MSPEQQLAAWALAVIAPFCLNAFFNRHPDAVGLSAMMIVGWGFQRVCWTIWTPPEAMQFYPIMDAAFGLTALGAWSTQKSVWKLVLSLLFVIQCSLHASFWLSPATASLLRYIAINNILFALELSVVASPGVGSALAILARHRGARSAWLRPHAGP